MGGERTYTPDSAVGLLISYSQYVNEGAYHDPHGLIEIGGGVRCLFLVAAPVLLTASMSLLAAEGSDQGMKTIVVRFEDIRLRKPLASLFRVVVLTSWHRLPPDT